MANPKPYVVGVAGGSASGKTSFLRDLVKRLPAGTVALVSQDNYYQPREMQQRDESGEINFDLPTSVDREKIYTDLCRLLNGECIDRAEYTFNNPAATPKSVHIEPAPIIVMEGLFVFYYSEIRKLLDLKVYIDARDEVKLKRRILRDALERGYPESTVRYQWDNHVMPSYRKFLKPYRDTSDVIITNNKKYDRGLEVLISHLQTKLQ